jgi:hypothetical protein
VLQLSETLKSLSKIPNPGAESEAQYIAAPFLSNFNANVRVRTSCRFFSAKTKLFRFLAASQNLLASHVAGKTCGICSLLCFQRESHYSHNHCNAVRVVRTETATASDHRNEKRFLRNSTKSSGRSETITESNQTGCLRMPRSDLSCSTAENVSTSVYSHEVRSALTSADTFLSSFSKESGTLVPYCRAHLPLRPARAEPPRSLNFVLETAARASIAGT